MKQRRKQSSRRGVFSQLQPQLKDVCLESTDHSIIRRSAIDFFQLRGLRDPHAQAARLAEQFVWQNRALTNLLDVNIGRDYDGNDVQLVIQAGNAVGAIPLLSPITAQPGLGLVIKPRFPWSGIGPMLAEMGWRVTPKTLPLPLLQRSERRVPLWVLSLMILSRLKDLLDAVNRRFELTSERRTAPRGRVNWPEYATRSLPKADYLSVPCTFPDLVDDRLLLGAIRYALERHLRALETQREHGAFVHTLIEFGQQLYRRVQIAPIYLPTRANLNNWLKRPLRTQHFASGLQAIEWTIEERGLAGVSDLAGIPWTLRMDEFFEAWVETVFRVVARQTGAEIKVGRNRETTHPIDWDPPYLGSQKALVPDIWLDYAATTLIVDAKYKRHWEELQQHSWSQWEEQIQEQHRSDLLQVLAYANLAPTQHVIVCLVYPCSPESWLSLRDRGRLVHRADIAVGSRALQIWLTAIPMAVGKDEIALLLAKYVRKQIDKSAPATTG